MRILLGALLTALIALVVGTLLTLSVLFVLGLLGVDLGATLTVLIMVVLTQGVAFWGVALSQFMRLNRQDSIARYGLQRPRASDLRAAAVACVWALTGAALGGSLAALLGADPAENQVLDLGREDPKLFLILMPIAVLLIGPGEELLFRGIVQTRLRDAFSARWAVPIASLIFAVVHVFSVGGAWSGRLVAVAILFFPSLAFGVLYERRKNLWAPALAHGFYDVVLFGLAYASTQSERAEQLAALLP